MSLTLSPGSSRDYPDGGVRSATTRPFDFEIQESRNERNEEVGREVFSKRVSEEGLEFTIPRVPRPV